MKKVLVMIIVAIVAAFIAVSSVEAKTTQKKVEECSKEALLKGYGWAALYGAGVMAVGAGFSLIVAPAALPAAVAIVGLNSIVGASVGIGSSAVTRISDQVNLKNNPIIVACIAKISGK